MVIKTQNNVLMNTSEFNLLATYHIHSIVASILSLICLIHENEAFALTKYVREVVSFRNENSPHLLPPLRVNLLTKLGVGLTGSYFFVRYGSFNYSPNILISGKNFCSHTSKHSNFAYWLMQS